MCILLRKKIVYSLGITPHDSHTLWCGIKYGKLIKFDLEKQEVVSQNNLAHVKDSENGIHLLNEDGFDINTISPTGDPHVIATGADDGLIKLWDTRNFNY